MYYTIVSIGKKEEGLATGGDTRLLACGLNYEIIGPGEDGGPTILAACETRKQAEAIVTAFRLMENI